MFESTMFKSSMFEFMGAFVDLFVLSAPWLLLGFAIAGGIKAFLQTFISDKL